VPIWPAALEYSKRRIRPGRTTDVINDMERWVDWGPADDGWMGVLADPQTSGGLLMSVESGKVDALLSALESRGESGAVVGQVADGTPGTIRVA
jgi:hypothetical protein